MSKEEKENGLWDNPLMFILIPIIGAVGWGIHSHYANTAYTYSISVLIGFAILIFCWTWFDIKFFPILIFICTPLITSPINDANLKTIKADCELIGSFKNNYYGRWSSSEGQPMLQLRCGDESKELGVFGLDKETIRPGMRIQLKSGLLGFERI